MNPLNDIDIIRNLLEAAFCPWKDDDKYDVLQNKRPTCKLPICAKKELKLPALETYHKTETRLKITLPTLIEDGFESDSAAYTCLVAESTECEIVGYAIYHMCYSTWKGNSIFLRDLFVDEKFRNLGVEKKLFTDVAKVAYKNGQRLDFYLYSWSPKIESYTKLEAENISKTETWQVHCIDGPALKSLFD